MIARPSREFWDSFGQAVGDGLFAALYAALVVLGVIALCASIYGCQ